MIIISRVPLEKIIFDGKEIRFTHMSPISTSGRSEALIFFKEPPIKERKIVRSFVYLNVQHSYLLILCSWTSWASISALWRAL